MKKIILMALSAIALSLGAIPAKAQSVPGVQIIYIYQYSDIVDYPQIPSIYRNPSSQTLARAQDEIRKTPAIRQLLERRNIPFNRVNAVKTALNGGKVVYVD
ncbi:hypothetical protein [Pararhizobium antarcticum]|uniref:Uncharacterized protein n=1 Tax=Pararhizobium antarcticum TaxID=1798805 RepID=A0A657LTA7_9HYPH|nr:hypothetical protein [Pararhizobium antarcticum]OJF96774.1 hypothetical protein AX760_02560 [Pararhizobium antarcticum]OJF98948.1 hypothetical protein AX761_12005 [Rhizobium sp. 58]